MTLNLLDSDFQKGVSKWHHEQSAGFMMAVDELQKQYNDGTLEVVSLQSYNLRYQHECPIWYEVVSYAIKSGKPVVNECKFFSSHYVGRFNHKGFSIAINPRFGNVFGYLVGYATNLYLPTGHSELAFNTSNNSYWLIALLWKAMLNKALTTGHIPKEYKTIKKNQKHYRGHLCVNKHIHANLCKATRFYCEYKVLSMDNLINRTIRTIYQILKRKGATSIIGEFEAYDKYLESMGVESIIQDVKEIENVRYTRLNEPYRPVMNLSKTILSNYKAEATYGSGVNSNICFFIDIAELWEMYLLKLLQNRLPSEYYVYSPNSNSGAYLINGNMREIRPDIIIEKNGQVMMIVDAKYKNYTDFGRTSEKGIHREDLYQMSTYLYYYGKQDKKIVGIITSPVEYNQKGTYGYSHNGLHRIGLINLNIEKANDNVDIIHEIENEYINNILAILKSI